MAEITTDNYESLIFIFENLPGTTPHYSSDSDTVTLRMHNVVHHATSTYTQQMAT